MTEQEKTEIKKPKHSDMYWEALDIWEKKHWRGMTAQEKEIVLRYGDVERWVDNEIEWRNRA